MHNDRLQELGYNSYDDYLHSKHWYVLSKRYYASKHAPRNAGGSVHCAFCECTEVELHHVTYARLGKERLADLRAVCRKHHAEIHERRQAGISLRKASKLRPLAHIERASKKSKHKPRQRRMDKRYRIDTPDRSAEFIVTSNGTVCRSFSLWLNWMRGRQIDYLERIAKKKGWCLVIVCANVRRGEECLARGARVVSRRDGA